MKPGIPDKVGRLKSTAESIGFDHHPQNGCLGIIGDLADGTISAANRTTVNQNQDLTRTGLSKTQLELYPEVHQSDLPLMFQLF